MVTKSKEISRYLKNSKTRKLQSKKYEIISISHKHETVAGRGKCSECGCLSYRGDGSYCDRDTCGHSYGSHSWRD